MSSPSTIYLVTGTNKGIGLAPVEHIAEKHPDAFIYAGARDPANASDLQAVVAKYPGRLSTVKCVSGDKQGMEDIASVIKTRHGRVDTVIANAAYANMEHTAIETPAWEYEQHFTVNVVGPVVLLNAVEDLLKASAHPRFVPISTLGGSIGHEGIRMPTRGAAYGTSKAALNYLTRKIHFENEWLTVFPLAPGAVTTPGMLENVAKDKTGLLDSLIKQYVPQTPNQGATALMKIIDESTREKNGGLFYNFDGSILPW